MEEDCSGGFSLNVSHSSPNLQRVHWSVRNATAKVLVMGLMSPDISREHMMSSDSVHVCVVKGCEGLNFLVCSHVWRAVLVGNPVMRRVKLGGLLVTNRGLVSSEGGSSFQPGCPE